MHIAHGGLGVCLIGVTWASAYGLESDFRFAIGEPIELAGYRATLEETSTGEGPNYAFNRASFVILAPSGARSTVHSEKRNYRDNRPWLTEAGILSGWHRDVLVQLGEPLGGGAWSARLQYRPLVRWIWLGGSLMALGGLIAAIGRYASLHAPGPAAMGHGVRPAGETGGSR
jgi:cytochrome c-type biogenesis protein CcmF